MSIHKKIDIHRHFLMVNLIDYFNNDGISYDDLKCDGDFDSLGATYPAEELPNSNSIINMGGIPFIFPNKEHGEKNNMILTGQTIPIDENLYKSLFCLGAVEGQNGEVFEEEITVSFTDGSYNSIFLGLSNWLLQPVYNEKIAFICSHLHYPDSGQTTIKNTNNNINTSTIFPLENNKIDKHYFPKEIIEDTNNPNFVWRPRIFMQEIPLNFNKPITALTFMENLNFHIFSITLEINNNCNNY